MNFLLFLFLLPRNAIVVFLRIYRAFISPIYGSVCRFYPSCSQYAVTAFQKYGISRGLFFTVRRLLRCHPWSQGGIDDVPSTVSLRNKKYRITQLGCVVPHHRKG